MLAALLTAILWSLSVACAHRSAKLIGGTEANFWRLTLATMLLAAWAHLFGRGLSGVSFPLFLWSGIIGIGLGDVALFQALPRLGSRLSMVVVHCLATPFAALIEFVWLGTRLTPVQLLFAVVILVGIGLALKPRREVSFANPGMVAGVLFGALAALGTAFGAVLSRKGFAVAAEAGLDLDGGTTAYQRLVGGLFIAGLCLLFVKKGRIQSAAAAPVGEKWKRVWPWVAINAIAGQTLGVSCYQLALKTAPTGVVLPIVALAPLAVIPIARFVENERPEPRSILGSVIAVAGVIGLIVSRQ